MALTKCKECGEKVSTKAKACPKCGAKPRRKTSFVTWGVILIIALGIYGANQNDHYPGTPQTTSTSLSNKEMKDIEDEAKRRVQQTIKTETIYYAKKAVARMMKDPDSAQFKDVFFNQTKKGGPVACGRVNSKNSYGAYSGFQRFISNGKTTFLEERDKGFVNTWVAVCLSEKA